MPRMRILTASEQEAFDKPPLFDYKQRKQFFHLPKALLEQAETLRTPDSQIGFLLLCGYFKATKRFFLPEDFLQRDIEAVARQLELDPSVFNSNHYKKTTRLRQQKLILEFYGFEPFSSKAQSALSTEIMTMAKAYLKPKLIFDRCLDFLIQKRIELPNAWTLTELIRSWSINLITLINTHLDDKTRHLFYYTKIID